jgi:hypothetical protein
MADLIFKLFSLQKGSMRAWRWHRITHALWLLPLFTGLLVWNNIALALDWLFFQGFQNQEVKRPFFVHGSLGVFDSAFGYPAQGAEVDVASASIVRAPFGL